ncbi:hypothetical protein TEA_017518 [Camellia sinensis var. sinensis]|uniref:Uncharacterized protein n=1 Tax=Camellia sinensis var. sinensis TaxID=542762 RepID=A0A4S4F1U4_CAMSN|nr:hypothetical protein TEA_017518 [Camellia sinensis var. sinensis]
MLIATGFTPSGCSLSFTKFTLVRSSRPQSPLPLTFLSLRTRTTTTTTLTRRTNHNQNRPVLVFSGGGDGGNGSSSGGGGGGGGGGGEGEGFEGNKKEAILALAEMGRSLDSIPKDLAAAIESGKIPGSIVLRYFELEKSPLFRWLLQFGGFKERLLADDLFFAKVAMECGVGIFTKTAAEYERRREKFFKELEFVCADVVMAIIADFMLVYLPAPTVSLRPPVAVNAGSIAKFFYNCPDNAFQRNGAKLFVVGTASSLIGTVVTNALMAARKFVDKSFTDEVENVPVLATSVAYGVYMAVSSNLRYVGFLSSYLYSLPDSCLSI